LTNNLRLSSRFAERVRSISLYNHTSQPDNIVANSLVSAHSSSNLPPQAVPVSRASTSQNLATPESHSSASRPSENRLSCQRSPRPSQRSQPTLSPRSQQFPVCSSMEELRSRFSICLVLLRVPPKARAVVDRSFRLQRLALYVLDYSRR
jgi:hypothetical protein